MLKIFTTQLTGIFGRIRDEEEFSFEDSARLLAQAAVGDGQIYVYGEGEMEALCIQALEGEDKLPEAKRLIIENINKLSSVDRVVMFTRFSNDEQALPIAKALHDQGIPLVLICGKQKDDGYSIQPFVDSLIDTKLLDPIIPDDDGTRFGMPSLITALFGYYGLYFPLKEMIAEYRD